MEIISPLVTSAPGFPTTILTSLQFFLLSLNDILAIRIIGTLSRRANGDLLKIRELSFPYPINSNRSFKSPKVRKTIWVTGGTGSEVPTSLNVGIGHVL